MGEFEDGMIPEVGDPKAQKASKKAKKSKKKKKANKGENGPFDEIPTSKPTSGEKDPPAFSSSDGGKPGQLKAPPNIESPVESPYEEQELRPAEDYYPNGADAIEAGVAGRGAAGGSMSARDPSSRSSTFTYDNGDADAESGDVEAPDGCEDPTSDKAHKSGATSFSSKKQTKRQKNPLFKDVQETGKWGSVSKKEVFIVIGVVTSILVAIVVVVAVLLARPADDGASAANADGPGRSGPANSSKPEIPEFNSFFEKYGALLEAIGSNELTAGYVEILPADAVDLRVLAKESTDPVVQAAMWLSYQDEVDSVWEMPYRFALASIYFATGGNSEEGGWTSDTNWLSPTKSVCGWERVRCSGVYGEEHLDELDLSSNNLSGEIPVTAALLTDLNALWLNDNSLTGPIPGDIFGSLPELSILYLQDNDFSGTIPGEALLSNNSLGKMFTILFVSGTLFAECPNLVVCHRKQAPFTSRGTTWKEHGLKCFVEIASSLRTNGVDGGNATVPWENSASTASRPRAPLRAVARRTRTVSFRIRLEW